MNKENRDNLKLQLTSIKSQLVYLYMLPVLDFYDRKKLQELECEESRLNQELEEEDNANV